MMFLLFFIKGAFYPIISLYLKNYLHFTGTQAGTILATSAISAFTSPLIGAFIADRLIRAEKLIVIAHIVGSVIMMALAYQTEYFIFLSLFALYSMTVGPTVALAMSVTFHHSPDANHKFGNIRVWGTIGWIAAAWLFSFFWLRGADDAQVAQRLPDMLKLSAISSLVLGLYCLTLPKTNVKLTGIKKIIPKDSFAVMLRPEVLLLCVIAFLVAFIDTFYYFGTAPFLKQIGFRESSIMPMMSMGQITEIGAMGFLGYLLLKAGYKKVLLLGLVMELVRFSCFTFGDFRPLVFFGIFAHGPSFALIFVTLYIYIDAKANTQSRSGVHQLFAIIYSGLGGFAGHTAAGWFMDLLTDANQKVDYMKFWLIPLFLTIVSIILLAKFLPNEKVKRNEV